MNILLISGSPRKGNTEFAINEIKKLLDDDSEVILLREQHIKHCLGCLYCHDKPECSIKNDDIGQLLDKLKQAEVIVLGTPNYFENVSGLTKDFIDRLHPLYRDKSLKGKKFVQFMVGGGKIEGEHGTQRYLDLTMSGIVRHLGLNLVGSYSFRGLELNSLKNNREAEETIKEIAEKINLLVQPKIYE